MYLLTVVYITVARLPVVLHWTVAELCSTGVAEISGESGQWIDGRRVTKVRAMHVSLRSICTQQVWEAIACAANLSCLTVFLVHHIPSVWSWHVRLCCNSNCMCTCWINLQRSEMIICVSQDLSILSWNELCMLPVPSDFALLVMRLSTIFWYVPYSAKISRV